MTDSFSYCQPPPPAAQRFVKVFPIFARLRLNGRLSAFACHFGMFEHLGLSASACQPNGSLDPPVPSLGSIWIGVDVDDLGQDRLVRRICSAQCVEVNPVFVEVNFGSDEPVRPLRIDIEGASQ